MVRHTVYLDGTKQEIQIQPRRQFGTLLQFSFETADKLLQQILGDD